MYKETTAPDKIKWLKIEEVYPYECNNKIHRQPEITKIANSIKEFGWTYPILIDENNIILAGHKRLLASKQLGLTEVPTIQKTDLTDAQKRAYRIIDNKSSEESEYDPTNLTLELDEIKALDFDISKFINLNFDLDKIGEIQDLDVQEDDYDAEPPAEPKSKYGDMYKLGNHYLLCGDATKEEYVEKLMNGNIADITFTSPPYGVSTSSTIRDHIDPENKQKKIKKSFYINHEDNQDDWFLLMSNFFQLSQKFTKSQFINVQMLGANKLNLCKWVFDNSNNLVDIIVWNKHTCPPQIQHNILNNAFEFVFCFDNENNSRTIRFGNFRGNISNYIETNKGKNRYADIHRAVFPVDFPSKILKINELAKTIYDPFGGTGTTLIACEQLNRNCYMMELDPAYCDVIIDRWEKFTGRKAEKIN